MDTKEAILYLRDFADPWYRYSYDVTCRWCGKPAAGIISIEKYPGDDMDVIDNIVLSLCGEHMSLAATIYMGNGIISGSISIEAGQDYNLSAYDSD